MFQPDDYNSSEQSGTNNSWVQYQYENLWAQGELNVQLGQRVALGVFYNKSFFGSYVSHDGNQDGQDAEHLMYGVLLRLSSGRSVRVRPYLQLKYFKYQMVVHNLGYDVATSASGATTGIGLMIRLSNKLYLNIPDLEFGSLFNTGDVLFRENTFMLKAGAGITYNFSRRK